jgi:SAM-dependent methyltransferase
MRCAGTPSIDRPRSRGVATDASPTMLDAARARFAGDAMVEIVAHDLDAPLSALGGAGAFDAVVSCFAIHHCSHARKRALYAEVSALLEPGGVFYNLEHVASPTPELHEAFFVAMGMTPADEDESNQLLDVETQTGWLREIGFAQVDCFWKWRELALFGGVKP